MKYVLLIFSSLLICSCQQSSQPIKPRSTASTKEIIYFGDSQATLWLGRVIGGYFNNIHRACKRAGERLPRQLRGKISFTGYATGSSSFKHWVASSGTNRDHICGNIRHSAIIKDRQKEKGLIFNRSAPFICQGSSAVDGVFDEHSSPSLVILNFMGNAAADSIRSRGRNIVPSRDWGFYLKDKYKRVEFDLSLHVRQFISKIPDGVPCLVMTTTPNKLSRAKQMQRIHAQAVIEAEVMRSKRCSFVRGVTESIDNVFAKTPHFHGDSYHVSLEGGQWWLNQLTPDICVALSTATRLTR